MRTKLMVAVSLLVIGSGCSSQSASSPTTESLRPVASSAAPSTTAPATTASAAASLADAADTYLSAVSKLNCALQQHLSTLGDVAGPDKMFYEEDWPAIQQRVLPSFKEAARATVAFAESIAQYKKWPAELQDEVDNLVASRLAEADQEQQRAEMTSWVAYRDAGLIDYTESRNLSAVIRAKLGLPTNIGTDVNFCQ